MATKSIVSIYINEAVIELTEVLQKKSELTVLKAVTIKTPENSVADGEIRTDKIGAIATAIRTALDLNGIKSTKAAFTINSSRIANKEAILPLVKPNKIAEIIQTNISEYFPISMDKYVVTYTEANEIDTEEGRKLSVLAFAAPEALVDNYYAVASECKLTVQSVDYIGNSAASLIEKQLDDYVNMVIHMDRVNTIVSVFKNNKLRIQRIIPYGKDNVLEAVMAKENISYEEADEKVRTKRYIYSTLDKDEVTKSLEDMINNVLRVADYFSKRYPSDSIAEVSMAGEAVSLTGIEQLFANELKYKVRIISDLKGVNIDPQSGLTYEDLAGYSFPIGALVDPVDFQSKRQNAKIAKEGNRKVFRLAFLIVVFLSVCLVAMALPGYLEAKSNLENVNRKIKNLEGIQDVVDKYYAAKDRYNDADNYYDLSTNNDNALAQFIDDLEEVMPSDVTITGASVSDGSISMSCVTSTKDTVAKFIVELKKLDYVSNVSVSSLNETKNSDGVISNTFSLTCNFSYDEDSMESDDEEETEETETETADEEETESETESETETETETENETTIGEEE